MRLIPSNALVKALCWNVCVCVCVCVLWCEPRYQVNETSALPHFSEYLHWISGLGLDSPPVHVLYDIFVKWVWIKMNLPQRLPVSSSLPVRREVCGRLTGRGRIAYPKILASPVILFYCTYSIVLYYQYCLIRLHSIKEIVPPVATLMEILMIKSNSGQMKNEQLSGREEKNTSKNPHSLAHWSIYLFIPPIPQQQHSRMHLDSHEHCLSVCSVWFLSQRWHG